MVNYAFTIVYHNILFFRCSFYLLKIIDMSTCLTVMACTESLPVPAVFNLAKTYALNYFDKLIWTPEFKGLPFNILMDYLSDNMINTKSELKVFIGAVNWLKTC